MREAKLRVRAWWIGTWVIVAVLLTFWMLGAVRAQILAGALGDIDRRLLLRIHEITPSWLLLVLYGYSRLVTAQVLTPGLALATFFLWRKGRTHEAIGLLCAVLMPALLALVAKGIYATPRPDVSWAIDTHWSSSYPSGHVALALNIGGMTTYFIYRHARRFMWPAALLTALGALAMGHARMALGVHFPSDIVAGYALGFIWLVTAILIATALRPMLQADERAD